jgi:uncharacterized protein (TIGR03435 family)
MPPGTTREQFRLMLQDLLTERFRLAFHYEKRDAPTYELAVAKSGLKMKESPVAVTKPQGEEQPQASATPLRDEYGFPPPPATYRGTTMSFRSGVAHWVARGATVDQVAGILSRTLGRPVTDLTGLKGKYDFTLNFSSSSVGRPEEPGTPDAALPGSPSAASLPTVFGVLQDQLGLRLEQKKGSMDLFVIDHVEKTPVAD